MSCRYLQYILFDFVQLKNGTGTKCDYFCLFAGSEENRFIFFFLSSTSHYVYDIFKRFAYLYGSRAEIIFGIVYKPIHESFEVDVLKDSY